jgi:hypothetical protein
MSSLLVFNRVHRLEIQSVMLVFSTSLVNSCPSNRSLLVTVALLPPPFPRVNKYTLYTRIQCVRGG